MREVNEGLLEFIDDFTEKGRDDLEIGILYSCIGLLYGALDAIKIIVDRNNDIYKEDDPT